MSTDGIFFGEGSNFYVGGASATGEELVRNNEDFAVILYTSMLLLSAYSVFVFIIYSSLSIGQLSIFYKRRDLMSIGAFLGVSLFSTFYYKIINNIIFYANLSVENLEFIDAFKKVLTIGIL